MDRKKLAEVLFAAADIIDAQHEKIAAVEAADHSEKLATLRETLENLMADPEVDIPEEILEKVAAVPEFESILGKIAPPEGTTSSGLGEAVPRPNAKPSMPKKEEDVSALREKVAADAASAEEALLSFCVEGTDT